MDARRWNAFWRRLTVQLLVAIRYNHLLNINQHFWQRSMIVIGDHTQGRVFNQPVIVEMQALREAGFRDLVNARNIGNGHPRSHGCRIPGLNTLVILLKMLISLDCAGSGEACEYYSHAQQDACIKKFRACLQANCFPS